MKIGKRNKYTFFAILAAVFAVLLGCNWLTLYISDDFAYCFSFADGSRIEKIIDVFPSMVAHAKRMNGRIVVHSLVQLFSLLPMIAFDVVNAGVFTIFVYMVYLIGMGKDYSNWNGLILLGIFAAVWLYIPVFSEIVLWQDGACNYLWAIAFGLLWIKPFVDRFDADKQLIGGRNKILYWVCSFLMGAYTECVSAACICMGILFVLLIGMWQKKKNYGYLIVSLACSSIGYLTIYLSPAQWSNKAGAMDILSLIKSVINITVMCRNFSVLWVIFAILLTLNLIEKTEIKTVLLAIVFLCGSLAAHYIMVFATNYALRASGGAFAFLLVADIVLLCALWKNRKYRVNVACLLVVATLALIPALAEAANDIGYTYLEMKHNESYILECKENGIMDITVPIVTETKTQYSVGWRPAKYLDEDLSNYKNTSMAKYYGVNSITGVYQ